MGEVARLFRTTAGFKLRFRNCGVATWIRKLRSRVFVNYVIAGVSVTLHLSIGTLANAQVSAAAAGDSRLTETSTDRAEDLLAGVLSPEEWMRVDASVNRALNWLASQQQADGSFRTIDTGQPGVTSLCMLAFMAHGHAPGKGPFGNNLDRAAEFVISCQKENGLLTLVGPDGPQISREVEHEIGTCAAYNHAISSLTLSELYGMSEPKSAGRIQQVIDRSLAATLIMQRWSKRRPADRGGWRYVDNIGVDGEIDSDLSLTGWELMFLRSARNAGFNVPGQPIDDAVQYVRRCYSQQFGAFQYATGEEDHRSRGMAGAGILALAHAGFHGAPEAQLSAQWIIQHNFDQYNVGLPFQQRFPHDRYHYALFNCCQGMYQLGGRAWEEFFPRVVGVVLAHQQPDGSWPADSHWHDGQFGTNYTTALVVLALGAPNQLLPIFQR
jgi:hypothetical protein